MSRHLSHRRQAKPSGMFPTECRRNFSRLCSKPLRAKPKQARTASSCSCSTMRDGIGQPISKSPMVFTSFICHPTLRSCSPPKRFGRSSTSRSSTSTSQPSQTSTRISPVHQGPLQTVRKSKAELDSIGGQSQSLRTNQPEMVSGADGVCLLLARRALAALRRFAMRLRAYLIGSSSMTFGHVHLSLFGFGMVRVVGIGDGFEHCVNPGMPPQSSGGAFHSPAM